jgi:hypothetical protein
VVPESIARAAEARLLAAEVVGALCIGAAGPGLVAGALVPHASCAASDVALAVFGGALLSGATFVLAPRAEQQRAGLTLTAGLAARLLGLGAFVAVVAGLVALFPGVDVDRAIARASVCVATGLVALVAALVLEVRRLAAWSSPPPARATRVRAVVLRTGGGLGAAWLAFVLARVLGDAPVITPLGTAVTLRASLDGQGLTWALAAGLAALAGHALRRVAWATLDGV